MTQRDELKELQDKAGKYDRLVFENRQQLNEKSNENEKLQDRLDELTGTLAKAKKRLRKYANETKIKDQEEDADKRQAHANQTMKVRKLCREIVDQFLQDIRTGEVEDEGSEDQKEAGDEQSTVKNKAVIEICFGKKTARFNVNDPKLKKPFNFLELAQKAAQFFSLPPEQIFFLNEESTQIYLPEMDVKKSLFPLGSANIVGYFPKVHVTLQRGHTTERFILRDVTDELGKDGKGKLSLEEQLLQKREKEEAAKKKLEEGKAKQEEENRKIQQAQKIRVMWKFLFSLLLVCVFIGLFVCFIISGNKHQHVKRSYQLFQEISNAMSTLTNANQKSTFYTALTAFAVTITNGNSHTFQTGALLRTPFLRMGVDLATLGTCEYTSSQSPDGCKQDATATVHPRVTAGLVPSELLCGDAFTYRTGRTDRPYELLGRFRNYEPDGFFVDVPVQQGQPATPQNYFQCLQDNNWLDDRQMRAVSMRFNVLDPNTSLIVQTEVVWESPVLGRLFAKITHRTLQTELFVDKQAIVLETMTFILCIFMIVLSILKLRESYADLDFVSKKMSEKDANVQQIIDLQKSKKKVCRKPSGSEIFNFITLAFVLFTCLIRMVYGQIAERDIKLTDSAYSDYSFFFLFYQMLQFVEMVSIFLLSCSLFSYMNWVPSIGFFLSAQKRLFEHSFFATLALLLGLTLIFSVVLYLAFGTYSLEYSSYNGALVKTMLLFFKGGVLSPQHQPLGSMVEDSETVIYRFGIFTFFLLVIIIDILIRYIFFNLIVAELINEYNKVHELQRKEQVNRDLLQRELARDQLRKRRFFRNKDKDKENDNKNKKP